MKPSGRLVITVWCPIEECKGHYAVAQALARHGIDARAAERPFALGKTDELRELAQQAGFHDIDIQTVSKFAHFSSPQAMVESLAAGAPSTRRALAQVSESARRTIIEEVSASLAPYVTDAGLAYPNASLVLIARS